MRCKFANDIVSKTRLDCRAREKFELELQETNNSLKSFWTYIDYEKKINGEKSRIVSLFERAVIIHCLEPSIWAAFITFYLLNNNFQEAELVASRAVRNCMYSADLWCHYLDIKSLDDASGSGVDDTYQKALSFLLATNNAHQISEILINRLYSVTRNVSKKTGPTEIEKDVFKSLIKSGFDLLKKGIRIYTNLSKR